jgi:uncharacterized integral membrane protein
MIKLLIIWAIICIPFACLMGYMHVPAVINILGSSIIGIIAGFIAFLLEKD